MLRHAKPSPVLPPVPEHSLSVPAAPGIAPSLWQTKGEGEGRANEDGDDESEAPSTGATPAPRKPLVLTPNEIRQYRVAGLDLAEHLPGKHFPHRAVASSVDDDAQPRRDVEEALADLKPPVYLARPGRSQGTVGGSDDNLRRQHLANLNAILHHSLQKGDYPRAERAWSLLLRRSSRGRPLDIREQGLWGIGAELLLRRSPTMPDANVGEDGDGFVDADWDKVRDYYERLILQYSGRRKNADSLSALHIYPVMFAMWVFVVQGRSKRARKELLQDADRRSSEHGGHRTGGGRRRRRGESGDDLYDEDAKPHSGRDQSRTRAESERRVRQSELHSAEEIAAKMDEILSSPPYDKSVALLRLRDMLALWIADLAASVAAHEKRAEKDDTAAIGEAAAAAAVAAAAESSTSA